MTPREVALLAAGSLGFALLLTYPMMCQLVYLGPGVSGWIGTGPVWSHLTRLPLNGDWDLFTELRWAVYETISHFHQLPLWNPYKCGGMPLLGSPEAIVVTPFLLVDLLAGPTLGLYLQLILHLAIAFAGGYVLARVMELGRVSGIVLSAVFLSTSWLYLQLSLGNLTLSFPIAYWPWLLALFLVGIERAKLAPLAVAGALLALNATEGNYTFIYASIMIASIGTSIAIIKRRLWPLIAILVTFSFGAAIGAITLIPVADMLAHHPRTGWWTGPEDDTLAWIPTFLFSRNQDLFRDIKGLYVFACYGAYISPVFAALALVGIITYRLKALPWLVAAIVFLMLARGNSGPYCALQLLRRLPMCGNIAFPTRFIYPFVFAIAPLAAMGTNYLCGRSELWGPRFAAVLLAIGLADAWWVGPPNLRYLFHYSPPHVERSAQFRQFWLDDTQNMTALNLANLGVVHCWGYGKDTDLHTSVTGLNQSSYSGEFHVDGPGSVTQTEWTPNRLEYSVGAAAPAVLTINQNFLPGWQLIQGSGEVIERQGLLAVSLPSGTHDLALRYRPEHFALATSISLLGLIAMLILWKKDY